MHHVYLDAFHTHSDNDNFDLSLFFVFHKQDMFVMYKLH